MKLLATFVLSSVPLLAVAASVQTPLTGPPTHGSGAIFDPTLRAVIGSILREENIAGYSVGVLRLPPKPSPSSTELPELIEFAQWGKRTEIGDPVTKDTIIGIGSLSKAFTSVALGIVMNDFATGKNVTALPDGLSTFTWDTKVIDLLPGEFELPDKWATEKVSVRDFLLHSSGMGSHDNAIFRNDTALAAIKRLRYLTDPFELRQEWHYNNYGYILSQLLIERFSNQSHPEFMAKRLFTPLNMRSTSYSRTAADTTGRASQAFEPGGRRIPRPLSEVDMAVVAGTGGILTTASDMMNWARLLLGGMDNSTAEAIVPRTVLNECMRDQVLLTPYWRKRFGQGRVTYGFGFFQDEVAGQKLVYHVGSVTGVSALLMLLPQYGVGIVQMSNTEGKGATNQKIVFEIINRLRALAARSHSEDNLFATMSDGFVAPQHPTSFASSSPPNVDLASFAGTYSDRGYGNFTFCPPPSDISSVRSADSECKEVFQAYSSMEDVVAMSKKKLYGYRNPISLLGFKYLTITIRPEAHQFDHFVQSESVVTFDLRSAQVYTQGYGTDQSPFEYGAEYGPRAELSLVDGKPQGLGLFGFGEILLPPERTGKIVQERAEVWFTKVD